MAAGALQAVQQSVGQAGALSVETGGDGLEASVLSGLMRSVALEVPSMRLSVVERVAGRRAQRLAVGGLGPEEVPADVFGAKSNAGAWQLPVLGPTTVVDKQVPAMPSTAGLAYGVTGGLGGLGLLMACALVHQSSGTQVVLQGRSGRGRASPSLVHLIGAGEHSGSVVLARCDASLAEETEACMGLAARLERQEGCGRMGGVLHAAGVLADSTLGAQSLGHLRRCFAPKVPAAAACAGAVGLEGMEMVVQFSSISALCGSSGQTNYAAVNALLDTMARGVQAFGLPSRSVQWGPWSGVGMATQGRTMSRLELMGLVPLVPVMGLKALGHAVAASAPATLCANSPAYWPPPNPNSPRASQHPGG